MSTLTEGEFGYHELERAALGFVLEDESWPVFIEWMRRNHATCDAAAWARAPDLTEARRLWMEHSPLAEVRAAADAQSKAMADGIHGGD